MIVLNYGDLYMIVLTETYGDLYIIGLTYNDLYIIGLIRPCYTVLFRSRKEEDLFDGSQPLATGSPFCMSASAVHPWREKESPSASY